MKVFFILLMVMGACFALDPDAGPPSHGTSNPLVPETDAWTITLTSVNDVSMSWGTSLRGCDYVDNYGFLFVTDYTTNEIYMVDPSTGIAVDTLACPAQVPQVLGVCQYSPGTENFVWINDWQYCMDVYEYSTLSGWSFAFGNPAIAEPRGMDMDPSLNIWEIDASSHILYVFDTSGSVYHSWTLTELPSDYPCGCSVFPLGSDLGVVIGGYAYPDFYFYCFDGSNLEYMGSAPVPQSIDKSYGVSYSYDTDSFYWVYTDPGTNFNLCEFTGEFISTALEQDTWGAIKAGF
ncbi:MAG: hypothetical protein K8S24_08630 [Candidatus Aegiribacteria sp.]|nr:hypothetical protein [Candidatus Aegiribacteria sp.]